MLSHQQQLQELKVQPDNHSVALFLCLMKTIVHYHLCHHEVALENAVLAEKYAIYNYSSVNVSLVNFYGSLIRLALLEKSPMATRRSALRMVKRNQRKMRHWADHAPANFLHKWHLVEAELARVSGNTLSAIEHFERAIALARENGFLQEQALAQKLAGQPHLARGYETTAQLHLRESWQSYRRWGALAKTRELESRYPDWLQLSGSNQAMTAGISITHQTSIIEQLDLITVVQTSQGLSQELVLDKLLKRFMEAAIEHAGAQRGVLLLGRDGDWYIEAEKSEAQPQAVVLQSMRLEESNPDALPLRMSMLRYVCRTGNSIVIHDAASDEMTAHDSYVRRQRPRSLLLLPMLHQARLIGMLYLENSAVPRAFTEAQLQVLQLLAAQTAISIENARQYADKDRQIAELRAVSLHES